MDTLNNIPEETNSQEVGIDDCDEEGVTNMDGSVIVIDPSKQRVETCATEGSIASTEERQMLQETYTRINKLRQNVHKQR